MCQSQMEHLELSINTTVKRGMTTPGWKDDCCVGGKRKKTDLSTTGPVIKSQRRPLFLLPPSLSLSFSSPLSLSVSQSLLSEAG